MVVFTGNASIYKAKAERSRPVRLQNKALLLSQDKEEKRKGNQGEQRGRKSRRGKKEGEGRGEVKGGRKRERKAEEGRQDEIIVINFQTKTCSHNCYL